MGRRVKKRQRKSGRGIRGLLFLAIMMMIAVVCVSGFKQAVVVKPELRHEEELTQSGAETSDLILNAEEETGGEPESEQRLVMLPRPVILAIVKPNGSIYVIEKTWLQRILRQSISKILRSPC